jgi:hypothetical protein
MKNIKNIVFALGILTAASAVAMERSGTPTLQTGPRTLDQQERILRQTLRWTIPVTAAFATYCAWSQGYTRPDIAVSAVAGAVIGALVPQLID